MSKQREGWQRGEGTYSSSKDLGLKQGKPDPSEAKDVSVIVEKNIDTRSNVVLRK